MLQAITGLGVGGAERVVLDLASHLDRSHFECEIVSFAGDTTSFEIYGVPDVRHHSVDFKSTPMNALPRLREYVLLLRKLEPDIVHAHMFHALALTVAAARFLFRPPRIVFTSHNSHISQWRAKFVRMTRWFRDADVIFVAGQHKALNAPRTEVIPNGVFASAEAAHRPTRTQGGALRFISIGRLVAQKDPIGLVEAFARAAIPKSELTFVGSGPLEEAVRARAAAVGARNRVSFLGVRSDVRALLRSADVFLMHSVHEGLPLALLEAGAEALPTVATPVGAIPEVLGDGRGYLARRDAYHLVLQEVANDPEGAAIRGRKLFGVVQERYSTSAMVQAHQHLYETIVGSPG